MLLTHAFALSVDQSLCKKSPYEYMHSVRIEHAKLILVVTRISYQATGDAGWVLILNCSSEARFLIDPSQKKVRVCVRLILVFVWKKLCWF